MKVKIGSLVKFYTVLLLKEGPKHGYELMKELEKKLGNKISTSQMYPFLSILEKENIIKFSEIGGREKKVYQLTKKGEDFVSSLLQRFGDLIYIAIEPKLTTCTHCGCKLYEKSGYKEKIGNKVLMFCCHHCAKSFKK